MIDLDSIVRRVTTYRDALGAPEHAVVDTVGVRCTSNRGHARAAFKLAGCFDDPFENGLGRPGGWWFAAEFELHLGERVVAPNHCG